MSVREGAVSLKGQPVDLKGPELSVGHEAPTFHLISQTLETIRLEDTTGTTRIIATVPSLDTSTCHTETKRFNEEAAKLKGVTVYVVSMDLPFGQKRWCGAEDVKNIVTLSDHRTAEFGENYGVLIAGGPLERCLTRAVFVIGPDDKLSHVEYVKEISQQPDYEAALQAAKKT